MSNGSETGIQLDGPLAIQTSTDERAMLERLQGNILKGHGRSRTALLLLQFDPMRRSEVRRAVAQLGRRVTNAGQQLDAARALQEANGDRSALTDPRAFVALALSNSGYEALGIPLEERPNDPAFRAGMSARAGLLGDPDVDAWEAPLREPVHALLTVAGDEDTDGHGGSSEVDAELQVIAGILEASGVSVRGVERSEPYWNAEDRAVEHFGYADGISQPLFLQEAIAREGANVHGSAATLSEVLVRDRGVADRTAFGSYLVFRKLEQNVAAFDATVRALADQLASVSTPASTITPADAGAQLVGRHTDGTPLVLARQPANRPTNDFDYGPDPLGIRCPFHAHVRKVNPRVPDQLQRRVLARRGVTYGKRTQRTDKTFSDLPSEGVGLLFMAYQASIPEQFEHLQASWANPDDFPLPGTGADPIIGQGGKAPVTLRGTWNRLTPKLEAHVASFVTLKGGEYFFAPSIPFLLGLQP